MITNFVRRFLSRTIPPLPASTCSADADPLREAVKQHIRAMDELMIQPHSIPRLMKIADHISKLEHVLLDTEPNAELSEQPPKNL